eukprot:gene7237-8620_t
MEKSSTASLSNEEIAYLGVGREPKDLKTSVNVLEKACRSCMRGVLPQTKDSEVVHKGVKEMLSRARKGVMVGVFAPDTLGIRSAFSAAVMNVITSKCSSKTRGGDAELKVLLPDDCTVEPVDSFEECIPHSTVVIALCPHSSRGQAGSALADAVLSVGASCTFAVLVLDGVSNEAEQLKAASALCEVAGEFGVSMDNLMVLHAQDNLQVKEQVESSSALPEDPSGPAQVLTVLHKSVQDVARAEGGSTGWCSELVQAVLKHEEKALMALCSAVHKPLTVVHFWEKLKLESQSTSARQAVLWLLTQAIEGIPSVSLMGASELADSHQRRHGTQLSGARLHQLVNNNATATFTSGLITGFGGFITFPVMLPTALGVAALSPYGVLRTTAEPIGDAAYDCGAPSGLIGALAGFNVLDPRCVAACLCCAFGADATRVLTPTWPPAALALLPEDLPVEDADMESPSEIPPEPVAAPTPEAAAPAESSATEPSAQPPSTMDRAKAMATAMQGSAQKSMDNTMVALGNRRAEVNQKIKEVTPEEGLMRAEVAAAKVAHRAKEWALSLQDADTDPDVARQSADAVAAATYAAQLPFEVVAVLPHLMLQESAKNTMAKGVNLIPVVGALVSGTVDGGLTQRAGIAAVQFFHPELHAVYEAEQAAEAKAKAEAKAQAAQEGGGAMSSARDALSAAAAATGEQAATATATAVESTRRASQAAGQWAGRQKQQAEVLAEQARAQAATLFRPKKEEGTASVEAEASGAPTSAEDGTDPAAGDAVKAAMTDAAEKPRATEEAKPAAGVWGAAQGAMNKLRDIGTMEISGKKPAATATAGNAGQAPSEALPEAAVPPVSVQTAKPQSQSDPTSAPSTPMRKNHIVEGEEDEED